MKTVYFVRHAESGANIGGVREGEHTRLSEEGGAQTRVLAKRCVHLHFETIITSPAQRAKDTAEAIARETKKLIECMDLFLERRRPSAQIGLLRDDPRAEELDQLIFHTLHEPEWRHSDEETFAEMVGRAGDALALLENRPESHLLVVSHGIFTRTLFGCVLFGEQLTPRELQHFVYGTLLSNTGISALRLSDAGVGKGTRWRMLLWNDHAHLG